jgi:hypothetical protein
MFPAYIYCTVTTKDTDRAQRRARLTQLLTDTDAFGRLHGRHILTERASVLESVSAGAHLSGIPRPLQELRT